MATIKEVARQANVSIATVSYVLNGTGSVSAGKRRAVLAAAEALGYRPSYRGRALQSQRSMALGLVLPAVASVADPSFGALLAGLCEGCGAGGYSLVLAPSSPDQPATGHAGQLYRSGRVDGIILVDVAADDERVAAALADGIPCIAAGRTAHAGAFVALDAAAGMLEAMAHLIVRGHERIALLQLPLEHTLAAEQEAGYREALDEAGIAFDATLVVEGGAGESDGYAATEELLGQTEPPTAILAGSAALAFGALHAVHDGGRSVGRDIALVSFEDTPAAAHTAPPLTALRQPMQAWGRALAKGLIEMLSGGPPPQEVVQPQLIVRHSCGE